MQYALTLTIAISSAIAVSLYIAEQFTKQFDNVNAILQTIN